MTRSTLLKASFNLKTISFDLSTEIPTPRASEPVYLVREKKLGAHQLTAILQSIFVLKMGRPRRQSLCLAKNFEVRVKEFGNKREVRNQFHYKQGNCNSTGTTFKGSQEASQALPFAAMRVPNMSIVGY